MNAYEIWLISALLVLAVTTLNFTVAGLAALVPRRASGTHAQRADPRPSTERPHRIERFVYRHHRVFGAAIVVGAGFYLWQFTGAGLLSARYGQALWQAGLTALAVVDVLLLVFGAVMFLRPSLLKRLEAASNRWVDWQHGRFARVLRVLLGLYCLAALAALLAERLV